MIDVVIREVGPRDGLQNLPTVMPTAAKLDWISREAACGVAEIEAASFVPPKLLPQFADAAEVCTHASALAGVIVSALVPNMKGAERAVLAGVDKLIFAISVSEQHNRANVRQSVAESLAEFERVTTLLRGNPGSRPRLIAGLVTSFGCTLAGPVPERDVRDLAERLVRLGADELLVADTVGYGDPAAVRTVFSALRGDFGEQVPLIAHFHDTRGMALANALAAYEAGVRTFDGALGGLGGCPYAPGASGNVASEDLVFMFESMGLKTGVDLPMLLDVRSQLERQLPDAPFAGSIARSGLPKGWTHAADRV